MHGVGEVSVSSLVSYTSVASMPVSSRYNFSSASSTSSFSNGRSSSTGFYSRSASLERSSLLSASLSGSVSGAGRYRSTMTSSVGTSTTASLSRRPPIAGSSIGSTISAVATHRRLRRFDSDSARPVCADAPAQISEARKYLNERKALDSHPSTYRQRYQRRSSSKDNLSDTSSATGRSSLRSSSTCSALAGINGSSGVDPNTNSSSSRIERVADRVRSFESSRSSSFSKSSERTMAFSTESSRDHSPDRPPSVNKLRLMFGSKSCKDTDSSNDSGVDSTTFTPSSGKYSPTYSHNDSQSIRDNFKSKAATSWKSSSVVNETQALERTPVSKYEKLSTSGSSTESDDRIMAKSSHNVIPSDTVRRSTNHKLSPILPNSQYDKSKNLSIESSSRLKQKFDTIPPSTLSNKSEKQLKSSPKHCPNEPKYSSQSNYNVIYSSSNYTDVVSKNVSDTNDHVNQKSFISSERSSNPAQNGKKNSSARGSSSSIPSVHSSTRYSSPVTIEATAKQNASYTDRSALSPSAKTAEASEKTAIVRVASHKSEPDERIRGGRVTRLSEESALEEAEVAKVHLGRLNCRQFIKEQISPAAQSDSSEKSSSVESSDAKSSVAATAVPVSTCQDRPRSHLLSATHGLVGLRNIGNTCFMNSVIQCLSNTKALHAYILDKAYVNDVNSNQSNMNGALITAFAELMRDLWSNSDSSESPSSLTTAPFKAEIQRFAPRFMGYQQQDAQEFLRYLLEGLHEDVNRVLERPKPLLSDIDENISDSMKATESWKRFLCRDNSKFVDLFVGQLKSTLKCTVCGHESVTFDPIWDLSLPLPPGSGRVRLQACFDLFTAEEVLDDNEKPTCSRCEKRQKCTKSFSIHRFPRILVVHLKRFNPAERYRGKLNSVVELPLCSLDLTHFASGHTPCRYNLYGVANHSGTLYSGHYTAYCRHPYSGQWHEYNDSRVSEIPVTSVITKEAYVMFFELSEGSENQV